MASRRCTPVSGRASLQPTGAVGRGKILRHCWYGLKKPVNVTENRRCRKGTVREAVVSQPIERLRTQVLSEMTCKSPG